MTPVTEVRGVGTTIGRALVQGGYKTAEDLAKATPDALIDIPGIGERSAPGLIAAAKLVVPSDGASSNPTGRGKKRHKPAGSQTLATRAQVKTARKAAEKKAAAKQAEAEAKAKKKAKAKSKADKAAKKKKEMEAAISKAREKVKAKTKTKKGKKNNEKSGNKSKKEKKKKKKAKK